MLNSQCSVEKVVRGGQSKSLGYRRLKLSAKFRVLLAAYCTSIFEY